MPMSRVTRLNPVSSTISVARPVGTPTNVNLPCVSVTADSVAAADGFSVTVTPGTTAPLLSTTTPRTTWTAAAVDVCTRIAATRQPSNITRMVNLQVGAG